MIKVGIVYEVIPKMQCEHCNHTWVAVLENSKIDWGDKIEIRFPEEITCPNCKIDTIIYRDDEEDDFF